MTKKHFVALADAVRAQCPELPSEAEAGSVLRMTRNARYVQWEAMRDALADFCQAQNAQFDRQRWLGYIDGTNGPNGGKR